jgi:hypothetical protein
MGFCEWPAEAVEVFNGLRADNTKVPPGIKHYAKGGRVPPYRCASGPKVLSAGTLVRGACSREGWTH